jgi:hypothetical protein
MREAKYYSERGRLSPSDFDHEDHLLIGQLLQCDVPVGRAKRIVAGLTPEEKKRAFHDSEFLHSLAEL